MIFCAVVGIGLFLRIDRPDAAIVEQADPLIVLLFVVGAGLYWLLYYFWIGVGTALIILVVMTWGNLE